MAVDPAQKTIEWLRKRGIEAGRVERWVAAAKVRKDLFGWIDVIAVDPKRKRIVGIQATTGSNLSARVAKLLGECRQSVIEWLAAGGHAEVWAWRKLFRGRRRLWMPRIVAVTMQSVRNPKEALELVAEDISGML